MVAAFASKKATKQSFFLDPYSSRINEQFIGDEPSPVTYCPVKLYSFTLAWQNGHPSNLFLESMLKPFVFQNWCKVIPTRGSLLTCGH